MSWRPKKYEQVVQLQRSQQHNYVIYGSLNISSQILTISVTDTITQNQWEQQFAQRHFKNLSITFIAKTLINAIQPLTVKKRCKITIFSTWCYVTIDNGAVLPSFSLPLSNGPSNDKNSNKTGRRRAKTVMPNNNFYHNPYNKVPPPVTFSMLVTYSKLNYYNDNKENTKCKIAVFEPKEPPIPRPKSKSVVIASTTTNTTPGLPPPPPRKSSVKHKTKNEIVDKALDTKRSYKISTNIDIKNEKKTASNIHTCTAKQIYKLYIEEKKIKPIAANHLTSFAKQKQLSLKYMDARKIIENPPSDTDCETDCDTDVSDDTSDASSEGPSPATHVQTQCTDCTANDNKDNDDINDKYSHLIKIYNDYIKEKDETPGNTFDLINYIQFHRIKGVNYKDIGRFLMNYQHRN